MRFSNVKQIAAMTLLWAGTLIVCDRLLSRPLEFGHDPFAPKVEAATKFTTSRATTPQIRLSVSDIGCNGDTDGVLKTLKTLPGLGEATVVGQAKAQLGPSCEGSVVIEVRDLQQVDLMGLASTLRKITETPADLEVGPIRGVANKRDGNKG